MIIIQWSFWLVETDPSLAQNFAVNHHGPYWNGFKFVWISIIRHTQIHQIHCLNPYWSRHHEITMKIPILRRARCQVRSILFLLATFEDEALLMAKSLPDQVGVAGMASCFCWLQWWWGTGFGSSKIRKLAILWCCKVIWPSSIRSSLVKWMNLGWFMLIWKVKYLRNGHWIQQNIVMNHQIYWCTIFRQTHIVCFPPFSGVSDPKWLNMKFRGWNHQTDERIRTWNTWQICQDWIGKYL